MNRNEEALKAFIGIRRTADLLEKHVAEDVKRYGLNINEFGVLELLYHKGSSPVQKIKEKILVASSSTTYVIDKLCAKGLVYRHQSEEDRRITLVSLSHEGYTLIDEIFPSHAIAIEVCFDSLNEEELSNLRTSLKKISAKVPTH